MILILTNKKIDVNRNACEYVRGLNVFTEVYYYSGALMSDDQLVEVISNLPNKISSKVEEIDIDLLGDYKFKGPTPDEYQPWIRDKHQKWAR